jgi:hypothetical protein
MRAEAARVMPAYLRDATLKQPAAAGWEGHDMLGVKLDLIGDDGAAPIVPPAYQSNYQDYNKPQRARHRGPGPAPPPREPQPRSPTPRTTAAAAANAASSHMQRRAAAAAAGGRPVGAESPHVNSWGSAGWDDADGEFATSHLGEYASKQVDAQRGFERIMDEHSLHEFIIRRGKTLDSTPEFESFRRAYAPTGANGVAPLVNQLEKICERFRVPLAVVDGKALAGCAAAMAARGDPPAMGRVDELLRCLVNVDVVAPLISFGGDERAAVTVGLYELNAVYPYSLTAPGFNT